MSPAKKATDPKLEVLNAYDDSSDFFNNIDANECVDPIFTFDWKIIFVGLLEKHQLLSVKGVKNEL